jgi:uncharacterized protein
MKSLTSYLKKTAHFSDRVNIMKLSLSIFSQCTKRLFLVFALFTIATSALAVDLATAKSQGLVGEGKDGYLGYVVRPPSSEVKSLVLDVNAKRKNIFSKTAKKNKLSPRQVAGRFYERAVGQTKSGHYYQSSSGGWVKK